MLKLVRARPRVLAAVLVAAASFAIYRATLLPGVDFGDTGSFQAMAGSPFITPRDGYPLYFALADLLVWAAGTEPAHTLNLASAIEAALACGIMVIVAADLSGSALAASAAALLFAGSYTFWSQAIIAEVYALHALFFALTLLLLLRWQQHPTTGRLGLFFAVYALGFGNHLSMILLAPGYTLFLLLTAPRGWRSLFAPRIVGLAIAIALAGALQYAWNLSTLWVSVQPPHGLIEALRRFWFDVTKTDWRETMVLNVPSSMLTDRLAMYWFDLRQQIGWPGVVLAIAGFLTLAAEARPRAMLMATLYVVNVGFAYSYNVGDAHVFYLPSHLVLALAAAPGIVAAAQIVSRLVAPAPRARAAVHAGVAAFVVLYAGARVYRDYPALDRSGDRRPAQVLAGLTADLDDQHAILLTDLNWQVQNGLSYFTRAVRPQIADARMPDVLLYAPALVRDNFAIGRDVVLTARARAELAAAFGPLLPTDPDPRVPPAPVADLARQLPAGTRYVLCVLRPSRDVALDRTDLEAAVHVLGADASFAWPDGDYTAVAGVAGQRPSLSIGADRPFTRRILLDGVDTQIRMESWVAADTIRRMGFGQVVAGREHTLIVERGASFAAFGPDGRATHTAYLANIFAPQPRYLVRRHPDKTP
jgi:transmembrane protein TMEM260 (protein O-mannosyltransferase)